MIKYVPWERITRNYGSIKGPQMTNSFIILMALSESKKPLSTTKISEKIAANSKGKLFKVSGALKDLLENNLRKAGYVTGVDVAQEGKKNL